MSQKFHKINAKTTFNVKSGWLTH